MALVSTTYFDYGTSDLVYQRSLRRPQAVDPALAQRFQRQSTSTKQEAIPRTMRQTQRKRTNEEQIRPADSDIDEGYHADRDHRSRKLRVNFDLFLEVTPSSPIRKSRCNACYTEITPGGYRLRSVTTAEYFHVVCVEQRFNLDQAFGRIYPSPALAQTKDRAEQTGLDESARELLHTWKSQRRREGLADCLGPDSSFCIEELWAGQLEPNALDTGENAIPTEGGNEGLKQRVRPARRQTAPQLDSSTPEPWNSGVLPQLSRGNSLDSWLLPISRNVGMTGPVLPSKLSDALKLLKGARGSLGVPSHP